MNIKNPLKGIKIKIFGIIKIINTWYFYKTNVYLLEITITQQMQTLNILLTIAGTEGRDTTWKQMVWYIFK